ncbi:MAG: CoA ester lyase [Sphingomonadales bacterium]|nr:CoA ester lyase [Sphingomonadaceae bacterium]MBS3932544.1 CoA ester lyase [Sphingomonadales bacterium]
MSKSKPLRSWMFVPGDKQRFLDKSQVSGADVVMFDLEDGVVWPNKPLARTMVAETLKKEPWDGPLRYVRVNAPSTDLTVEDIYAVAGSGLDGICLTKVESAEDVHRAAAMLETLEFARKIPKGQVRILAAIESANSLQRAGEIARAHERVIGLIFGAEDYALDLGLPANRIAEASELLYARAAIVNAAAAARVLSIDGVFPNLEDPDGLLADAVQARRLGFTSKSTFNPRQIEMLNEQFSPTAAELAYAQKVADAFNEAEARGDASVAVGGQLVDKPIVLRALRLLEAAAE